LAKWPAVDDARLPDHLYKFDCRNNRLAELALQEDGFFETVQQAAERWGRRRVGVFLGTSTAGILQTELAYRERDPVSGALPPSFEYGFDSQLVFPWPITFAGDAAWKGRPSRFPAPCASSAKVFGSARG